MWQLVTALPGPRAAGTACVQCIHLDRSEPAAEDRREGWAPSDLRPGSPGPAGCAQAALNMTAAGRSYGAAGLTAHCPAGIPHCSTQDPQVGSVGGAREPGKGGISEDAQGPAAVRNHRKSMSEYSH
jgi:hypothetical protein